MKRLTVKADDGTYAINKRYTAGNVQEAVDRLAAYEDTGLEPEEIYENRLIIATQKDPQKLRRLAELVNADSEGRLMMWPCKVGDTVYISGHKYAAQIDEIVIKAKNDITFFWLEYDSGPELTELWDYGEFTPEDIGKTVFLSREEAERALDGGADNG